MVDDSTPVSEDTGKEAVKNFPPDYALKKMIGEDVNIKEVFSEESVAKAQKSIDKHQDSFLDWASQDIALLNEYYAKSVESPSSREAAIIAIEEIADRLKSQAGTFNFGLATLVAKSLEKFCNLHPNPHNDHLVVIRKHIDTLTVIFNQKIMDDGGAIGNELLDSLSKLVEKYN